MSVCLKCLVSVLILKLDENGMWTIKITHCAALFLN